MQLFVVIITVQHVSQTKPNKRQNVIQLSLTALIHIITFYGVF